MKIAYRLKTAGHILIQFYMKCVLLGSISRIKVGLFAFDL